MLERLTWFCLPDVENNRIHSTTESNKTILISWEIKSSKKNKFSNKFYSLAGLYFLFDFTSCQNYNEISKNSPESPEYFTWCCSCSGCSLEDRWDTEPRHLAKKDKRLFALKTNFNFKSIQKNIVSTFYENPIRNYPIF